MFRDEPHVPVLRHDDGDRFVDSVDQSMGLHCVSLTIDKDPANGSATVFFRGEAPGICLGRGNALVAECSGYLEG